MSGDVERHRRLNRAFNDRDEEALVSVCDEAVEIHSVFAQVGGATYHGHEGARRWLRDIVDSWAEFRVDVEATHEHGDRTLAHVVLHGRGSRSGVEVVMPYAQVMRWRDGRCVWFKAYADRDEALASLG